MWFTPLKTYPSSTSAKVPYGNRKGGESNASTKHIARGHVTTCSLAMFVVRKESLFDSGLLDSVIVFYIIVIALCLSEI